MRLPRIYIIGLVLLFSATSLWSSISLSRATSATPQASPGFDSKMLRKEFRQAQDTQLKLFEEREKKLAAQFTSMQATRQKDFETSERAARHKYFSEPHPGAEKRSYMQALIARREQLRKSLNEEKDQFQADAENRLENLIDKQQKKRALFEAALKKGQRPDDVLWPQPNAPAPVAGPNVDAPLAHSGK